MNHNAFKLVTNTEKLNFIVSITGNVVCFRCRTLTSAESSKISLNLGYNYLINMQSLVLPLKLINIYLKE